MKLKFEVVIVCYQETLKILSRSEAKQYSPVEWWCLKAMFLLLEDFKKSFEKPILCLEQEEDSVSGGDTYKASWFKQRNEIERERFAEKTKEYNRDFVHNLNVFEKLLKEISYNLKNTGISSFISGLQNVGQDSKIDIADWVQIKEFYKNQKIILEQ